MLQERQSSNNKEDADEELEDVNLDHSVEEVLYTNFNHPQEDSGQNQKEYLQSPLDVNTGVYYEKYYSAAGLEGKLR